jgi:hypothetical protein
MPPAAPPGPAAATPTRHRWYQTGSSADGRTRGARMRTPTQHGRPAPGSRYHRLARIRQSQPAALLAIQAAPLEDHKPVSSGRSRSIRSRFRASMLPRAATAIKRRVDQCPLATVGLQHKSCSMRCSARSRPRAQVSSANPLGRLRTPTRLGTLPLAVITASDQLPSTQAAAAGSDRLNERGTSLVSAAFTRKHQRAELRRCVSRLICARLTETMHAEHPCEHKFDNQE